MEFKSLRCGLIDEQFNQIPKSMKFQLYDFWTRANRDEPALNIKPQHFEGFPHKPLDEAILAWEVEQQLHSTWHQVEEIRSKRACIVQGVWGIQLQILQVHLQRRFWNSLVVVNDGGLVGCPPFLLGWSVMQDDYTPLSLLCTEDPPFLDNFLWAYSFGPYVHTHTHIYIYICIHTYVNNQHVYSTSGYSHIFQRKALPPMSSSGMVGTSQPLGTEWVSNGHSGDSLRGGQDDSKWWSRPDVCFEWREYYILYIHRCFLLGCASQLTSG